MIVIDAGGRRLTIPRMLNTLSAEEQQELYAELRDFVENARVTDNDV